MNLTHGLLGYEVYSSSNYGNAYNIAAPGYKIVSADGDTIDGYKTLTGTSMASPIVSFGAALATLKYGALAEATGSDNAKTPRQIADIIKSAHSESLLYKTKNINVFDMSVFAKDEGVYSIFMDCDSADLKQKPSELREVRFEATLLPANEDNEVLAENVKWYKQIDDDVLEELGTGRYFSYTPDLVVGEHKIVAKYFGDKTLVTSKVIEVEYVQPSKTETKIETNTELEECVIGNTLRYSIQDVINYSATDVVIWYVNGEYAWNGFIFDFTPEDIGEYTITCKMNGIVLDDKFTVTITLKKNYEKDINTYLSIGFGSVLALVAVSIVIVWYRKEKLGEKEKL